MNTEVDASSVGSTGNDNPFSIVHKRNIQSPKRIKPISVWSEEEILNKLQGYLEINNDLWGCIKYGSHIRYINKNNEFKGGGFVLKNPINLNKQNNDEDKKAFLLQSSFNKSDNNYLTWFIQYSDIKKLYLKVDASIRLIVHSLELTIDSVNNNMKKISQYIKKIDTKYVELEDRIQKLEKNNY